MKGMLLDNDYELQVAVKRNSEGLITESIIVGDITYQNQEIIIKTEKGEIKEAPLKGVGALGFLDDDSPDNFMKEIRVQLTQEGMQVNRVEFNSEGKLVIDANY